MTALHGIMGAVKRHRALIPLSHDHHHALVAAKRLREAAAGASEPGDAVAAFAAFFREVTIPHFREEEEVFFPLVATSEEARPFVVRALLEHQELHALVAELGRSDEPRSTMGTVADLLEAHVRLEERELFPLVERLALGELERLPEPTANGPLWGLESSDLNATLLAWQAGKGPSEHANAERDVLIFVTAGSATVEVEGERSELPAGHGLVVDKGRRRRVVAGPRGVEYLSVHLRRPPLQIRRGAS